MAPDDERKRRESAQPRTLNNPSDGSNLRSTSRLPTSDARLGSDALAQAAPWNREHPVRDPAAARNDRSLHGPTVSAFPALSPTSDPSRYVSPASLVRADGTVPNAPWGQQSRVFDPLPTVDNRNPQAPPLPGGGSHNHSMSLTNAMESLALESTGRNIGPIGRPNLAMLNDPRRPNLEPDSGRPSNRRSGRDDGYPSGDNTSGRYNPRDSPGRPDDTSDRDRGTRYIDSDLSGRVAIANSSKPYTGVGLLSVVWIGRWRSRTNEPRDQRLALKTFNGTCPRGSSTFESNLRREAHSWAGFDHENLLPFIGICWDSVGGPMVDAPVLVTPYCSEGNIRDYLKEYSGITPAERIELIHQIANGLHYLHDMRYVHGNLKGKNILIDEEGIVRIADYGLTRLLGVNKHSQVIRSAPQWAAPELILVEEGPMPLTTASDVWAFGMVVLEVMTSADPWHPMSGTTVLLRVAGGTQPERQNYPNVGRDIWDVLKKCWEFDPRRRPRISRVKQELPPPPTATYSRR